MRFEHFALNVADPPAVAKWYVDNCGMKILTSSTDEPFMHFLADSTDRVVVELYYNPKAAVPDYANQDPLIFHFALQVEDPEAERDRLLQVGASVAEEVRLPDGSHLIMMRDPWGLALQLCKRANPFNTGP
jgi:catechol 2,3-dioxygenase-like lactoylglutathione lyase family enzyme